MPHSVLMHGMCRDLLVFNLRLHQNFMRKTLCSILIVAFAGASIHAATKYWDINGTTAGAGGATPTGNWGTGTATWGDSAGTAATANWVNGDTAVFSAGTDASGSFTVTVNTPITLAGITREEGSPTISAASANILTFQNGNLAVDSGSGTLIVNAFYAPANGVITKTAGSGIFSSGTSQTSFAGKWIVNSGSLSVAGDVRLGVVPAALVPDQVTLNGGKLRTSTGNAVFTANRGITLGASGGGFDQTVTMTWSGPIAGTQGGNLTQFGTGTTILAGVNTYNGNTAISAGTIQLGAAGVIPDSSVITFTAGSTVLNLAGYNETVKSLSGSAGAVRLNGGTLTLDNPNGESFTSAINNDVTAGGKVVMTRGTWTDGQSGNFDGGFTLNGGILNANAVSAFGNGGTLTINGGTIANTSSSAKTYNANPVSLAADAQFGNSAGSPNRNMTFQAPWTLRNGDRQVTVDTIILTINSPLGEDVAGRRLIKAGSGSLVLGGANTYSGGTVLGGGTLEIGTSGGIKGDVSVIGSQLKLSNVAAMETTANLTLPASPPTDTVNLNFSGTQTINALHFGTTSKAAGTWGAIGNTAAAHQNAAFTGTGILNVTSGGTVSATVLGSVTPDPSCAGTPVSLTATVTGSLPSGTVQFFESGNSLGTAPLSEGQATLLVSSFSAGTHANITARYLGDDNNNGSVSGPSSLTVNPTPTCSTSGSGEVCFNSVGNSYTAPAGMSTYAWSISGNGTISGASDAQSVSVSAGDAGSFNLHLAIADSNGCSSSCDKMVSVVGATTITTDLTNLTVCVGSQAAFYAAAAGLGLTWQWQLSTDSGANWADITTDGTYPSYTNAATVIGDNLNQYRVIVSGCSQSVTSTPSILTVNPTSVGGTATATSSSVYAGNGTTISLSGQTGSIVKWQSSTDAGLNWTDIASIDNPLSTGNLSATTEFRAAVQSGVCSSANSSATTVTVLVPPVANNDSVSGYMNQPLTFNVSKLLANDSDLYGYYPLSVVSVNPTISTLGSVALSGSSVTYTPPAWYFGMDNFSYTISNTHGGTATALIEVFVSDGIPPVSVRVSIAETAPHVFTINFAGVPGQKYDIQRSTDMVNWTTLATRTATLQNRVVQYVDTDPPSPAFYRVAAQ
jgi:fibronectin-binding autotransporter adhesin